MKRYRPQTASVRRRGTLMPALAMSIVVVCLATALVLDRLWLDAARVQLRTAAEAAAFAAAARLADNHRLRSDADPNLTLETARQSAAAIAAQNDVAGVPVSLNAEPEGDVRFGVVTDNPLTGEAVFLETPHDPTTVLVSARASRGRGNGVALFFRGLTGVATGDVMARAGVTIDNSVLGVRALAGVPVPALPLGILEVDASGARDDTWNDQITMQRGLDEYGCDENTHRVTIGADGIREITLTMSTAATVSESDDESPRRSPNACLVNVGDGLTNGGVFRQLTTGWTSEDLAPFGGRLDVAHVRVPMAAASTVSRTLVNELAHLVGQARICLLYQDASRDEPSSDELREIIVTGLIAGRILAIDGANPEEVRVVFQPAVITTPTAILAPPGERVASNPYIYKLQLTH